MPKGIRKKLSFPNGWGIECVDCFNYDLSFAEDGSVVVSAKESEKVLMEWKVSIESISFAVMPPHSYYYSRCLVSRLMGKEKSGGIKKAFSGTCARISLHRMENDSVRVLVFGVLPKKGDCTSWSRSFVIAPVVTKEGEGVDSLSLGVEVVSPLKR